jgi:shikimate dehydrogenase
MLINNKTSLYLSCSSNPGNFGATLYNYFFEKYSINSIYLPRSCESPKEMLESIKTLNCKGCSVSMPLKNLVIPFLDDLSKEAKISQSVNTIVNSNGKTFGYNTDIYGVKKVLEGTKVKKVLIYGSGSVVDSIVLALKSINVDLISIYSRNALMASKKSTLHNINLIEDINSISTSYDLLINATPSNFSGDLKDLFIHASMVFDLVVSPKDTDVISAAKDLEKSYISGIEMTKYQFQKQFFIYTGVELCINEIDQTLEVYFAIK